jgi:misacylated tRNA(Ala) deacylase
MTEALYQRDSYTREFEATIEKVDAEKGAVALDRSAFYPGGGGQPADTGRLQVYGAPVEVVKTFQVGDDVWHQVDGCVPEPGVAITGHINWDRRYRLMRTHTGLHILCGVIWRDYRASVTGGNMEPLKGRLDFEFETLTGDLVAEIEQKINEEVIAAREVRIRVLPREEAFRIPDLIRTKINLLPDSIREVRTVEIVDLDLQADGGTHVANTSEVGRIRIADYRSKGKINKRIKIELDP